MVFDGIRWWSQYVQGFLHIYTAWYLHEMQYLCMQQLRLQFCIARPAVLHSEAAAAQAASTRSCSVTSTRTATAPARPQERSTASSTGPQAPGQCLTRHSAAGIRAGASRRLAHTPLIRRPRARRSVAPQAAQGRKHRDSASRGTARQAYVVGHDVGWRTYRSSGGNRPPVPVQINVPKRATATSGLGHWEEMTCQRVFRSSGQRSTTIKAWMRGLLANQEPMRC